MGILFLSSVQCYICERINSDLTMYTIVSYKFDVNDMNSGARTELQKNL